MNNDAAYRVDPGSAGVAISVALALAVWGGTGCIAVDGGAAEFSWTLRTFEGDSIDNCGNAGFSEIRVCWRSAADTTPIDCNSPEFARGFRCRLGHGVTGFEIEPGRTTLQIQPVCEDGSLAAIGTYEVPPAIVRTVREGEVVTLNALLITAWDRTNPRSACALAGCTCDSTVPGPVAVTVLPGSTSP